MCILRKKALPDRGQSQKPFRPVELQGLESSSRANRISAPCTRTRISFQTEGVLVPGQTEGCLLPFIMDREFCDILPPCLARLTTPSESFT